MNKLAFFCAVTALTACGTGNKNNASTVKDTISMGFDGCYVLFEQGSLFPAFCLQGTTEEGINGSGVRLAIFETNTTEVIKCAKSSSLSMSDNTLSYEIDGKVALELTDVKLKDDLKVGKAKLGRTQLKFSELSAEKSKNLIRSANRTCKD